MGRKKFFGAVVGTISAALLMAGCSSSAAPAGGNAAAGGLADMEPIKLTVSNIHAETSTAGMFLNDWMEAVKEGSGGKVTFDYYGGGTLHPATEALSAIESGLTQVTFVSTGYWPDQLPVAQWDDKVFQEAVRKFGYPGVNTAGIPAQLAHYGEGSAVAEEFAKHKMIPLLPMTSGPAVLTCAEPFDSPEDLNGRQVRVPNDVSKGENEALGMTGVFLPPNEQYEALQRGVIDCAVNAPTTVLGGGLLEVAKYSAFTENAPSSGSMFVIAKDTWDAFPEPVKELMTKARNEALVKFTQNTLDVYAKYISETEAAGGEIVATEAMDEKLRAWHDAQPDLKANAPSGVADASAAVERVDGMVKDWVSFTSDELGATSATGLGLDE
ncbi:MAG TPA: TRAP transporter substrate-binding protein DctP, partial [Acidimicrobiales bacterium]|nr:TRAP transporter substrate-binding protein DctP [Acidimicrobiales bacterium]